jgi:glycosyltransferase involved in cell wall biosynthesis
MKLLAITTSNDRSEVRMYCAFAQQGMQVDLIIAPDFTPPSDLAASGVRVHRLKVKHRLDFAAVAAIRKMARQLEPDLIYAPRNSTLSVSLIATLGLPIRTVGYRGTVGHISKFDPASWLAYLNPRVAGIVCVSEAVRQYLLGHKLPADRLRTIYKGHDPAWYDGIRAEAWPAEAGISPDDYVVVFTGNIRPVKGVDYLLHAIAELPDSSAIKLVLIGEIRHPAVEQLLNRPPIAARVIRLGFRADAAALTGLADCFVMPSVDREGLPRAVIEAMAQRVPVVVSDAGGMPELVEHNTSGLVVPPRDAVALRTALLQLEGDAPLRTRLGEAGRARIVSAFHIDRTVEQMRAFFEGLL